MQDSNQSTVWLLQAALYTEQPPGSDAEAPLSESRIREWAYFRYLERQKSGIRGTPEDDWLFGEQLALIERHAVDATRKVYP